MSMCDRVCKHANMPGDMYATQPLRTVYFATWSCQKRRSQVGWLALAPALLAVLLALLAMLLPACLGEPPPERGLLTPERGLPPFLALLAMLPPDPLLPLACVNKQ